MWIPGKADEHARYAALAARAVSTRSAYSADSYSADVKADVSERKTRHSEKTEKTKASSGSGSVRDLVTSAFRDSFRDALETSPAGTLGTLPGGESGETLPESVWKDPRASSTGPTPTSGAGYAGYGSFASNSREWQEALAELGRALRAFKTKYEEQTRPLPQTGPLGFLEQLDVMRGVAPDTGGSRLLSAVLDKTLSGLGLCPYTRSMGLSALGLEAAGVRPGGAVAGWIRRASVPAERGGGRTTRSESSSVVWLEIWTLGAVLLPPRCGPISTPEMSATTAAADSIVDAGLEIVMNVSHACPSVQAVGCALSTTGPRR